LREAIEIAVLAAQEHVALGIGEHLGDAQELLDLTKARGERI
jgi:hypothetical protein